MPLNKPRAKVAFFAALVTFWLLPAGAFAQTIWTGGTGDWFNSRDWSAGTPSSSTSARINNGGTAQITASGAQVGSLYLGFGSLDSGTLSISGSGNLMPSGLFFIGESGAGMVSVASGGVISGNRFILGDNAGSTGTATVSDSGSSWTNAATCDVGFSGNASLSITGGGSVSAPASTIAENSTSTSMVTVDGAGSTWSSGNLDAVGGNGNGTLTITNGGSVSSGTATVGRNPGSQGTVTVSGLNSNWTTGTLAIGDNGGSGALHIMNAATVSSSAGELATANGSIATVTVDGAGSTWTNTGELFVGSRGSSATLSITNGGKVSNSNGYVSFGSASATVTVDGVGSSWTNSGNLYVGGSNLGSAGNGVLRIQNSGTVSATATTVWSSGALEFGSSANVTGPLTFDGGTLRSIANVSVGTLTVQGALTLKSNAAFKFELNSSTPAAAKIVANGVTISGATFSFSDLGAGSLNSGASFVIIDNTSNSAISGFFSNLADNSTFTNNGNTYLVSYEGGTGNDLTITVVPEPPIWQLLCAAIAITLAGHKLLPRRQAGGE